MVQCSAATGIFMRPRKARENSHAPRCVLPELSLDVIGEPRSVPSVPAEAHALGEERVHLWREGKKNKKKYQ